MSTFTWTLTDTSPDADPNGPPITEGTEPTRKLAIFAADRAISDAADAAGISEQLTRKGTSLTGRWSGAKYADGTVLLARINDPA